MPKKLSQSDAAFFNLCCYWLLDFFNNRLNCSFGQICSDRAISNRKKSTTYNYSCRVRRTSFVYRFAMTFKSALSTGCIINLSGKVLFIQISCIILCTAFVCLITWIGFREKEWLTEIPFFLFHSTAFNLQLFCERYSSSTTNEASSTTGIKQIRVTLLRSWWRSMNAAMGGLIR